MMIEMFAENALVLLMIFLRYFFPGNYDFYSDVNHNHTPEEKMVATFEAGLTNQNMAGMDGTIDCVCLCVS